MSLITSDRPVYDLPKFTSTSSNSLCWRLWHGINYMIGGVTFIVGSVVYYPWIEKDVLGGWLFTIGSLCFLFADLTEWNHFKLGCIGSTKPVYSDNSFCAKFRRVEIGLNFFCSACGSLLYLIGSIFFIPATKMLLQGEICFIIGSIVIFLSQLWKCIRTAWSDEDNEESRCANIMADFSGFSIDVWAGIGGLMYAIGTYLFKNFKNDAEQTVSVHFFVAGGISFAISGLFMQYRYFFKCYNNHTKSEERMV